MNPFDIINIYYMNELISIDPRQLPPAQAERQNDIRALWDNLKGLPPIHVSRVIENETMSLSQAKPTATVDEALVGLDSGRLVAIHRHTRDVEEFILMQLKGEGRYYQMCRGLSPQWIKTWSDPNSYLLPGILYVEKWNFGLRITSSVPGQTWSHYDFNDTDFFDLPYEVVLKATQLSKEIAQRSEFLKTHYA